MMIWLCLLGLVYIGIFVYLYLAFLSTNDNPPTLMFKCGFHDCNFEHFIEFGAGDVWLEHKQIHLAEIFNEAFTYKSGGKMKKIFKEWLEWLGYTVKKESKKKSVKLPSYKDGTDLLLAVHDDNEQIKIKKPKTRKHYSRPTKVQKPKKGKGPYKRTKTIKKELES